MTPSLILASSSPYRKELLQRIVPHFDCISPNIDEDIYKKSHIAPEEVATKLSWAKGAKIFEGHQHSYIISSDQLVDFEGKVLGKPGTEEKAVAQLLSMQGKTHRLLTAFHLFTPERVYQHLDITTLHMRKLDEKEIISYVRQDLPLNCAGSYMLEKKGIALFDKIESEDFSAIQGLPLIKLVSFLREASWPIF